MREDREEIVEALLRPSAYPHHPERITHLQTHISHLFVAPPFAYKLKKAVRLAFVDFSDPGRREWFCREEVRLNRRLCPAIYLGVVPVTRDESGRVAVGGGGEPLDHLVWMRELPARGMLPVALAEGRVTAEHVAELAARIAAFHAGAASDPSIAALGAPEAVAARWAEVLDGSAPLVGEILPRADHEILADFGRSFVDRHETLLHVRGLGGRIREGHGDLHGGNLCLLDDELPALADAPAVAAGLHAFDCLEFSRDLRAGDVASEVAFLAMDLEWRGRPDLAERFVAAYVERSEDRDLPLLLPYYASYRAMVRGMVDGLTSCDPEVDTLDRAGAAERARRRFRLAVRCAWRSSGPAIVACRGLSGSGKTTVALALADRTGFELVSSDEIRKRRAGLDPRRPAPPDRIADLYSEEARRATYEELARSVETAAAGGRGVIADATFTRRDERARIADVAARLGCPFVILDCAAPPEVVRERLEQRARRAEADDAPALSDAGWEVHRRQAAAAEDLTPEEPRIRVDTAPDRERVADAAVRDLWSWRRAQPVRSVPPLTARTRGGS